MNTVTASFTIELATLQWFQWPKCLSEKKKQRQRHAGTWYSLLFDRSRYQITLNKTTKEQTHSNKITTTRGLTSAGSPGKPQARDDHGAGEPEWAPAGVCILCWSRSQYFRFEPESTLRSVQELAKYLRNLFSVMMLVVVKQIENNWDVFSDNCCHISPKCDTGWEYRAFHHYRWFQSYGPCKN